jgi:hypothetical protein
MARTDPKQFNVPMPEFSHQEFKDLLESLRGGGSKPTKGDLVAALIHAAALDVEATKWAVENFVKFEMTQDEANKGLAEA